MIAVIIAGGKGGRLRRIAKEIPKPMIPIGGKPVLEHQICALRKYEITEIFILTGYLGHIIQEYFGKGKTWGADIGYFQETKPLGTAGCIKSLETIITDDFLVLYGDVMFDIKLDDFIAFHKSRRVAGTIYVHPNDHPYDSDLVVMDEHFKITGFLPKEREDGYYENLVNAAFYILSPSVFKYILDGREADFVKDIFPKMLQNSEMLYGYKSAEYIKDMGTEERLRQVTRDFSEGRIQRHSKNLKKPAFFLDRDGTLVKYVPLLHKVGDLELFPFSARTIKRINDSDYLSFLVSNQSVAARSLCTISELKLIHNKLETLLGAAYAFLDDSYLCPHHPDKGYPEEDKNLKIDCECRKPKTGMIEEAVEEYNVDRNSSWIIGDTTVDIETGKNAGLHTILVRTGEGGKDQKFTSLPDFVFDDLEEAAQFILEGRHRYAAVLDGIGVAVEAKYNKDSPFVIGIGGLARSGKSTFVNLLVRSLAEEGFSAQVISLDNWLISLERRSEKMTVRERYKYEEIAWDLHRLVNHETIFVSNYDHLSRKTSSPGRFTLDGSECLIIEGIPALDIEEVRNLSHYKIYVEVAEVLRKKRFLSFYRWKSLSDREIWRLHTDRLDDEVQIISESKKYANVVVEV